MQSFRLPRLNSLPGGSKPHSCFLCHHAEAPRDEIFKNKKGGDLMSKKWIAAAFAVPLLWTPVALAQDAARGGEGAFGGNKAEWHQKRCTERYARKAAHLAYLEAKLGLNDQQKASYTKWQQVTLDAAAQRRDMCLQHKPREGAGPTAIERQARREKWLSTRLQQLQAARPVLQTLYDSLTPEQKAGFDQAASWHRHGHHRHGWGHRDGDGWRSRENQGDSRDGEDRGGRDRN
jgi:hypothetical protein